MRNVEITPGMEGLNSLLHVSGIRLKLSWYMQSIVSHIIEVIAYDCVIYSRMGIESAVIVASRESHNTRLHYLRRCFIVCQREYYEVVKLHSIVNQALK